jgi:agmatinase
MNTPNQQPPDLAYAGINTYLRTDTSEPDELSEDVDVGVVGVPFDGGVSWRPGTRFGPDAIRQASNFYQLFVDNPGGSYNVEDERHVNYDSVDIRDCGDAPTIPTDIEQTRDHIAAYVEAVAEKTLPVVLGGDHYITYPSFAGFANTVDGDVGLIHLDAHSDTTADHEVYGKHWHASPMARIDELDQGGYENHAIIGLRSYEKPSFPEFVDERGLHVDYAHDVREKGISKCVTDAIEHATTDTEAVYLTVDIDAVDPSYAPGTGTPEPGGLTSTQLLQAMSMFGATKEIQAMDLVEVAPHLDPTDRTEMLAGLAITRFIEKRFC